MWLLFAVQSAHKRAGVGDPLEAKDRLWILLDGLKKGMAPAVRKLGVTPDMIRWIAKHLGARARQGGEWDTGVFDNTMLNAAVQHMFFYLCRCRLSRFDSSSWFAHFMNRVFLDSLITKNTS